MICHFPQACKMIRQFCWSALISTGRFFRSSWDSGDHLSVGKSTIVLAGPATSASHVSSSNSLQVQACSCKYFSKLLLTLFVIISSDKASHMAYAQSQWAYYQRIWIQGGVKALAGNLSYISKLSSGSGDKVMQSWGEEHSPRCWWNTAWLWCNVYCRKSSRVWQLKELSTHCWNGGGSMWWVSYAMNRASLMIYFGHVVGMYINLWWCTFRGPWDETSSAKAHYSLQGPEYHVNGEQLSQVILSRSH